MTLLSRFGLIIDSVRAGIDIARTGGNSVTVITDLAERLQTLREQLLILRKEVTTLGEEKRRIAERLNELVAFDNKRGNYRLTALTNGSVVYVPIGTREGIEAVQEPVHGDADRVRQMPVYCCANCFERRKVAYLQPDHPQLHVTPHDCKECGAVILIPNDILADVRIVNRGSDFDDFI